MEFTLNDNKNIFYTKSDNTAVCKKEEPTNNYIKNCRRYKDFNANLNTN